MSAGRAAADTQASARHPGGVRWAVVVASLMGLGLTGYMAAGAWARGSVAGCGVGSGCGRALGSPWAWWFGIPISGLAAGVYLLILLAIAHMMRGGPVQAQRRGWTGMVSLAFMLVGAAVWCFYLLLFRLRVMCPYCTASHLVGLVTAGLIVLGAISPRCGTAAADDGRLGWGHWGGAAIFAAVALAVLIGGQVYWPTATYALVEAGAVAEVTATQPAGGHNHDGGVAQASGPPPSIGELCREVHGQRVVAPAFTDVVLDPRQVPMMGPSTAAQPVILVFDYTCEACIRTHRLLWLARQRYGDQLGVLLVTCPVNSACNPIFKERNYAGREDACEYARLALALWRVSPQVFERFENWVIDFDVAPPIDVGAKQAIELAGREALEKALADPWVEEQLKANIQFSRPLMEYFGRTPVLILGNKFVEGIPDDPGAFCKILESELKIAPMRRTAEAHNS